MNETKIVMVAIKNKINVWINKNNINLKNIKSSSAPDKSVISTVTLSACDDREITKVIIDIRKSNSVISVKRL